MTQHHVFNKSPNIPGLTYIPHYISPEYEEELVQLMDSQIWNADLRRRTQHYGYKYDYLARSVEAAHCLGDIPHWIDKLCQKLYIDSICKDKPDQVIINEYMPGQGIASHRDCIPCFGDIICSISLLSGCMMDMVGGTTKRSIYLEPRSLLILQGDARYIWKHGIPPRKSDLGIRRHRRVSLTFRKVLL